MKLALIFILTLVAVPFGAAKSQGNLKVPKTAAVGTIPVATNCNPNPGGCTMAIVASLNGVQVASCGSVPPGGTCPVGAAIPADPALLGLKIQWTSVDLPPCERVVAHGTTTIIA